MGVRAASLAFLLLLLVAPPAEAAHATERPWTISGDAALREHAAALGITGKGTASNPYVIAGADIAAAEGGGIRLINTRAHVVIRDVAIYAGGSKEDGIALLGAENVTVERADLQFNRYGIHVQGGRNVAIRDSTIRASQVGIFLDGATKVQVERNVLAVNERDVSIARSSANVFHHNNLSIASYQTGFFFDDQLASLDNDIDATNVVNLVPMRWHTHAKGTPGAPLVIRDEAVAVKGITNVAQILCYGCSHVRFERADARSGSAAGILVERSANVTLANALAEANDGAGIQARNSSVVTINDSTSYGNAVGIAGMNATGLTIGRATVTANARGVLLQEGARGTSAPMRPSVHDSTIEANKGNGITVEGVRNASIASVKVAKNGAAGIQLTQATRASVTASDVRQNAGGGIVLGSATLLSRVVGNTLSGNGDAGIRLAGAGVVNRIESNELSGHARHIRIAASAESAFASNRLSAQPGETGFWFDDETSYNNDISPSNLVGPTPVQWHVALVGSAVAPVELRGLRVETANVTNVAQIMLYKSAHVRIVDAIAANGPRAIYVLRSSSVEVRDANVAESHVGIELKGTQTAEVSGATAVNGDVGVLLEDTLNVTVSDVAAPGARVAVKFNDTRSRGSLVERIDATGAREASILDPSIASEPHHLIADAGMDHLAGAGQNVSFADAIAVARTGSERIVRQGWDFGDGQKEERAGDGPLRPVHVYDAPGHYLATLTVHTADAITLTDTVRVRIVPPPDAPPEVKAVTAQERTSLEWAVPPSETPVTGYRVYRGLDPNEMVLMLETVDNATTLEEKFGSSMQVFYAISAVGLGGEGARSILMNVSAPPPPTPSPAPPPPKVTPRATPTPDPMPAPTPGASLAWLLVAAGAAALAMRGRRPSR